MKKYIITLTNKERSYLESIIKTKISDYKMRHAKILLAIDKDPEATDKTIAKMFDVHDVTIRNMRIRFAECGFDYALNKKTKVNT